MDQTVARGSSADGSRFSRLWPLVWLAWLPALIPSLTSLLRAHPAPLRLATILAGLVLFVAIYLWTAWHNDVSRAVPLTLPPRETWRWRWGPIVILAALSAALILGDGPRWLSLCIYTCSCAGARLPLGRAVQAVAALILLTVALGWLTGDALSDLALAPFWVAMSGTFVIILNYLRRTNRALHAAREENARLAVETERLRFARDLHDLLGHDLARIALQSEVVEALVFTAPDRAVATAREMGEAARAALQEVRAAVSGYRQPTLASELRGAGEILAAAGISYQYDGERVSAPSAVEATLAWVVREGVTNVVKHSRARRCTVRLTSTEGHCGVEVLDDGRGAESAEQAAGPGGNGLAGLSERVAALGGWYEAGPRPGGGYRLAVTLPVEKGASAPDLPVEPAVTQAGAGGRP